MPLSLLQVRKRTSDGMGKAGEVPDGIHTLLDKGGHTQGCMYQHVWTHTLSLTGIILLQIPLSHLSSTGWHAGIWQQRSYRVIQWWKCNVIFSMQMRGFFSTDVDVWFTRHCIGKCVLGCVFFPRGIPVNLLRMQHLTAIRLSQGFLTA